MNILSIKMILFVLNYLPGPFELVHLNLSYLTNYTGYPSWLHLITPPKIGSIFWNHKDNSVVPGVWHEHSYVRWLTGYLLIPN